MTINMSQALKLISNMDVRYMSSVVQHYCVLFRACMYTNKTHDFNLQNEFGRSAAQMDTLLPKWYR